jgi:hypothetical protein
MQNQTHYWVNSTRGEGHTAKQRTSDITKNSGRGMRVYRLCVDDNGCCSIECSRYNRSS